MNLPNPPTSYDPTDQTNVRVALKRADADNVKRGSDYEVGKNVRIIMTDTVTQARYALTVASGVLTLSAL